MPIDSYCELDVLVGMSLVSVSSGLAHLPDAN
jgi:hypothetical protein